MTIQYSMSQMVAENLTNKIVLLADWSRTDRQTMLNKLVPMHQAVWAEWKEQKDTRSVLPMWNLVQSLRNGGQVEIGGLLHEENLTVDQCKTVKWYDMEKRVKIPNSKWNLQQSEENQNMSINQENQWVHEQHSVGENRFSGRNKIVSLHPGNKFS